jgi:hypothetical protein
LLSLILVLGLSQASGAPKKVYKLDLPVDDVVNVQSKYQPFEPIIIGCICDAPPNTDLKLFWKMDNWSKYIAADKGLHVWSNEGEHWVELTIVTQSYREILVFVPDPAAPNDPSKAKPEKIRISTDTNIERFTKYFTVGQLPTPPPPVPVPVPTPTPTPDPIPLPPSAGPRNILILHETGSQTTEWGTIINNLSRSAQKDYPQSDLFILDSDGKDATGNPSKVVAAYKKLLPPNYTLPAIVIVDKASKRVLYSDSLSINATTATINDLIKKYGAN